MRAIINSHWFFILILIPISVFYFWGTKLVPFHPDESTQIFMSEDFNRYLSDPLEMIWEPGTHLSSTGRYRMLDAPLTRYLIGLGRMLASIPAQSVDWDWSKSWYENQQNGAFPNDNYLIVGRLSVAIIFPLGIILLYRLGSMLGSKIGGLAAVLFFGTNALVLLHTRRAMAESVLVFSIIASLYALLRADKRPLLAGLIVALAFNAKQSALALLPIGLLAVCWIPTRKPNKAQRIGANLSQYLGGFILLSILLNPFLWRHPIQATQEAIYQRRILMRNQVSDVSNLAPSQVLDEPSERITILLAQLFLIPPSFSEVGNYRTQTTPAELEYLEITGHQLGREPLTGGIILGITLIGIGVTISEVNVAERKRRRRMLLFLLAFLTMAFGQIVMVPLPWQRYSMPLIPFISLYFGIGFAWAIKNSRRFIPHGRLSNQLSKVLSQFSPDSWMS